MNKNTLKTMCSSLILTLVLSGSMYIENINGMEEVTEQINELEPDENNHMQGVLEALQDQEVVDIIESSFNDQTIHGFSEEQRKYFDELLRKGEKEAAIEFLLADGREIPVDYAEALKTTIENMKKGLEDAQEKLKPFLGEYKDLSNFMSNFAQSINLEKGSSLDGTKMMTMEAKKLTGYANEFAAGHSVRTIYMELRKKLRGNQDYGVQNLSIMMKDATKTYISLSQVSNKIPENLKAVLNNDEKFTTNDIKSLYEEINNMGENEYLEADKTAFGLLALTAVVVNSRVGWGCAGCLYAHFNLVQKLIEILGSLVCNGKLVAVTGGAFKYLKEILPLVEEKELLHDLRVDTMVIGTSKLGNNVVAMNNLLQAQDKITANGGEPDKDSVQNLIDAEKNVIQTQGDLVGNGNAQNQTGGGSGNRDEIGPGQANESSEDNNQVSPYKNVGPSGDAGGPLQGDTGTLNAVLLLEFGQQYEDRVAKIRAEMRTGRPGTREEVERIIKNNFGDDWTDEHWRKFDARLKSTDYDVWARWNNKHINTHDRLSVDSVLVKKAFENLGYGKYSQTAVASTWEGVVYPGGVNSQSSIHEITIALMNDAGGLDAKKTVTLEVEDENGEKTKNETEVPYVSFSGKSATSVGGKVFQYLGNPNNKVGMGKSDAAETTIRVLREIQKLAREREDQNFTRRLNEISK